MYGEWKMVEFLRRARRGLLEDLSYASGMSAKGRCLRLSASQQLGSTC